jgi:sec-independent protein translocase protein TatB
MFGIGGSEIIVILIVALLFLGPDKLPDAAKTISKGIRDLKKQSRTLQQTIENDERIGGAIRDIKSALRGEDPPPRPKPFKAPKQLEAGSEDNTIKPPETPDEKAEPAPALTMPATAGEPDPEVKEAASEELAQMIRPATGTVAKDDKPVERKHG